MAAWIVLIVIIASFILAHSEFRLLALWPSLVALVVVFTARSAVVGLLAGAISGSVLLAQGQLVEVFSILWQQ